MLEILMTLILIGVLAAVAVSTLTSSLSNENFDATVAEMNLIRNAVIGDSSELTRGVRTSFGYWGDVGALPTVIGDLLVKPAAVTASTVSNANRTQFGWNGPYLPTSDPAVDYTRDGWGNLYVWSPAASPPTLVSLGSDGAAGGTGLAQDITMQLPTTTRVATVNGFITTTGSGTPISQAATAITIYYPNGTGGGTSSVTSILAGASGYFSFASIPFGVRSLIFTVNGTTYGPVIFNVDKDNYTIPVSLTRTGNPCTTQTIQFASASSSGSEAVTSVNLVVQASATCVAAMTVNYVLADGFAIAPGDYTAASGTVTIPAGSLTANLNFTVINDTTYEANENLTATLSNSSTGSLGATTVHTYTINNDDAATCVSGATMVSASGTFTVPANCVGLVVKVWGAGGGGGQTSNGKAGDGAAGGYVANASVIVIPGETFTVTVGTGGRGGGSGCGAGGAGYYAGGTEGVSGVGGDGAGLTASGTVGTGGAGGFSGGRGYSGGGGGGAGNGAALRGGGGGGSTSVSRTSPSSVVAVAGGGGGGGGSANAGSGAAGSGGGGCGGAGSATAVAGRGGGGGGGECTGNVGATTGSGAGVTPTNSAQAGAGFAVGGTSGGSCASAAGGGGIVRFEYN